MGMTLRVHIISVMYNFQRLYDSDAEGNIPDLVMFHVTASDEEIARRMHEFPHEYPIVKKDILEVKRRFDEEISKSLFTHGGSTVVIDTTGKTPEESFDRLNEIGTVSDVWRDRSACYGSA